MSFKKRIVMFMLMAGMIVLAGGWLVQAQEVKLMLGESTYGISQAKLEQVANSVIQDKLQGLKAKSMRVQATLEAVGENYEKKSLDYEMTVAFLHKDTYTAEVKMVRFSLIDGETKNVAISDMPLERVQVVKKLPFQLSCWMKKGLFIINTGAIQMKDEKAMEKDDIEMKKKFDLKSLDEKEIRVAPMDMERLPAFWFFAKGLATTPCDTIPTAVNATNAIHNMFKAKYTPAFAAKRLGAPCTVNSVTNFLKFDSKLLAWNHIGHGWPGGVVLWDGNLTAGIIAGLNPNRGIHCVIALINSCNTFNDPLKAAFIANNPRTYIAGIIALPIGPSEQVDMCFWKKVLFLGIRMDVALRDCSQAQGLAGAFGLAGDGGVY